jgi:hypothetical protein
MTPIGNERCPSPAVWSAAVLYGCTAEFGYLLLRAVWQRGQRGLFSILERGKSELKISPWRHK